MTEPSEPKPKFYLVDGGKNVGERYVAKIGDVAQAEQLSRKLASNSITNSVLTMGGIGYVSVRPDTKYSLTVEGYKDFDNTSELHNSNLKKLLEALEPSRHNLPTGG
jgi:hypothetical protein